ncbi:hypothetical protein [Microbacterium esteraromaticum]|uniref:hypothetical protein n=1 Tax=Microbacterium esteraromaticum TaxID=57043 RepID=UPI0019D355FB|nr:hypothetical protein [Microbacterium esteraromaticum]MBN7792426.1 hypothetical protein [Microbacterium esteraromaticum]
MPITPNDLGGDEDTARRLLVLARSIAPCIDSFADESEPKKDAVAILRGVLAEQPAAGSRRTRSVSRNGTSMSFADVESAFDSDARQALRSLCGSASSGGHPVGSFPTARPFANVWPEGGYTS